LVALYFNCRITNQQLIPNSSSSGYFYPIVYPQEDAIFNKYSQYEILLKTLVSYSRIDYSSAVFNIQVDGATQEIENEIDAIVRGNFRANSIKINYSRPSTKATWIADINEVGQQFGFDNPVLIVMNHDHPFVDYTDKIFTDVVKAVFCAEEENFCKALYYSHAPEVISWAINGKIGTLFERDEVYFYESQPVNNWLDCFSVMTMSTLKHVFHNASCSSEYMGRFDWPGVKYSNLNIKTFIYPREFFRHFDGYGHITGMRLFSSCDQSNMSGNSNLVGFSHNEIINFYYQKWLDCFLLMIRDRIQNRSFFRSEKNVFIFSIEESLEVFLNSHLKKDATYQLINVSAIDAVLLGLKNKIYYNGNGLFQKILIDIKLNRVSTINKFRSQLLVNQLVIKLKNLLRVA
jgi:hypothetical protein